MHNLLLSRKTLLTVILLFVATALLFSCKRNRKYKKTQVFNDFSYDEFAEKLAILVPALDSIPNTDWRTPQAAMRYAYTHNDHDPIWLSHGYKADAAADKFIAELEDMKWDGMSAARYGLDTIKRLKSRLGRTETTIEEAIAFDTAMTHCYMQASLDMLLGTITPKKADSLWYHANDSVWNAGETLTHMQEKYAGLEEYRSLVPTYKLLREEYKKYTELAADTTWKKTIDVVKHGNGADSQSRAAITAIINRYAPWVTTAPNDSISEWTQLLTGYQAYMGLKQTGKTDSATLAALTTDPATLLPGLAANMERIRWMQRDFGDLYVIVDVPMMQLFLRRNGTNAMHMNVVVGKKIRQTPSLYARMANVVINPPWGVPPTILKKDVLPGVEKGGAAYLAKKGLKVYTQKGVLVNGDVVNAKNYRRYIYKQAPGDGNALGYVKFNLPNPWDIYLHDTPHRTDFNKRDRALSSGCVRVQKPQEMALFILNELEKRKFTQDKLDSIILTHKTQWNVLKNKIPVHITYLTAFEDTAGHLQYCRDVYGRDPKLIAMMQR